MFLCFCVYLSICCVFCIIFFPLLSVSFFSLVLYASNVRWRERERPVCMCVFVDFPVYEVFLRILVSPLPRCASFPSFYVFLDICLSESERKKMHEDHAPFFFLPSLRFIAMYCISGIITSIRRPFPNSLHFNTTWKKEPVIMHTGAAFYYVLLASFVLLFSFLIRLDR